MAKYGEQTKETMHRAMHKDKRGERKSGKSRATVRSHKQAIAIGLSEIRKKGAKVSRPPRRRRAFARESCAWPVYFVYTIVDRNLMSCYHPQGALQCT